MADSCVIGRAGFIGSALAKRLGPVTSLPTESTRTLYHFGSHTHPVFETNPEYEMRLVLDSFAHLLPYCHHHGILFVFPSSALVYEKETQFARFKKALEILAGCYSTRTLCLRIFPAYGPGESHTFISQACRAMRNGEQPIVYGDGKQERDFIFIDDVVDQILMLVDDARWLSKIADVGTGVSTSFNTIVGMINEALGTQIKPKYVQRPSSYSEGITCARPLPVKVSVETGIRKILECILMIEASAPSFPRAETLTSDRS